MSYGYGQQENIPQNNRFNAAGMGAAYGADDGSQQLDYSSDNYSGSSNGYGLAQGNNQIQQQQRYEPDASNQSNYGSSNLPRKEPSWFDSITNLFSSSAKKLQDEKKSLEQKNFATEAEYKAKHAELDKKIAEAQARGHYEGGRRRHRSRKLKGGRRTKRSGRKMTGGKKRARKSRR